MAIWRRRRPQSVRPTEHDLSAPDGSRDNRRGPAGAQTLFGGAFAFGRVCAAMPRRRTTERVSDPDLRSYKRCVLGVDECPTGLCNDRLDDARQSRLGVGIVQGGPGGYLDRSPVVGEPNLHPWPACQLDRPREVGDLVLGQLGQCDGKRVLVATERRKLRLKAAQASCHARFQGLLLRVRSACFCSRE